MSLQQLSQANNNINDKVETVTPELIKVNADNDSKQHVCLHWTSFFGFALIIFLCTLAIPDSLFYIQNNVCDPKYMGDFVNICSYNQTQINNSPMKKYSQAIYIDEFDTSQLFLYISADLQVAANAETSATNLITYKVSIWSVEQIGLMYKKQQQVFQGDSYEIELSCSKKDKSEIYLTCETFGVAYVPFIGDDLHLVVQVDINTTAYIPQFQLTGITASKVFTKALIAIRYFFLILSILCGLIYYWRYKKLFRQNVIVEQKLVLGMSLFLVFFNDPLFAATVLAPNRVTSILGVIFIANYMVFLMLFFMVSIQRMVKENGLKETKLLDCQKVIICFGLWICLVVSYSILETSFYDDPTRTYEKFNSSTFLAFKILSFILASLIFLFILVNYVMFIRELDTKIWRYKVSGLFQIVFILIFLVSLFTGSFQLYQFEGNRVLLTISFLNLYVYYMQYLWAPSSYGLAQQTFEEQVEIQLASNNVYDQLDEEGIKIMFKNDDILGELEQKPQGLKDSKEVFNIEE